MYGYYDKHDNARAVNFSWRRTRSLACKLANHARIALYGAAAHAKIDEKILVDAFDDSLSEDWFLSEIIEEFITRRELSLCNPDNFHKKPAQETD